MFLRGCRTLGPDTTTDGRSCGGSEPTRVSQELRSSALAQEYTSHAARGRLHADLCGRGALTQGAGDEMGEGSQTGGGQSSDTGGPEGEGDPVGLGQEADGEDG